MSKAHQHGMRQNHQQIEQNGHAADPSADQSGPDEASLASNNLAVATLSPDAARLKQKIAGLEKELKEARAALRTWPPWRSCQVRGIV